MRLLFLAVCLMQAGILGAVESRPGPGSDDSPLAGMPAVLPAWDSWQPPTGALADPQAPAISEFTRNASPGDCLVISGSRLSAFTDARVGSDTRFVAWGQDPSGSQAQIMVDCDILRLSDDLVTIRLPTTLPAWSTYALWPVNANGWGTPVLINHTELWWLHPSIAHPGSQLTLYGRQLAHDDGTTRAWTWIRRPDGTSGRWLKTDSVNPYRLSLTLPVDLGLGQWQVFVHNGHGGAWGWSQPLALEVKAYGNWNGQDLYGADFGMIPNDNLDDGVALRAALTALQNAPGGSTLHLAAGTFELFRGFGMPSGRRLQGAGMNATILRKAYPAQLPGDPFDENNYAPLMTNSSEFEIKDLTFISNGNVNGYIGAALAHIRGASRSRLVNVRMSQLGDAYGAAGSIFDVHECRDLSLIGCEFITHSGIFLGAANGVSFTNCTFKGINDCNSLNYIWGGSRYAFQGCTASDYDNSDETSGAGWAIGRWIAGNGNWGPTDGVYVGESTTVDLTPRRQGVDQNQGEQLMWEAMKTVNRFHPASASGDRLGVSDEQGDLSGLVGTVLIVAEGSGRGQNRRIVGWDPQSRELSVDLPWRVAPTAESLIDCGRFLRRFTVFDNTLSAKAYAATNPTHIASAGIQPYGASVEIVVDRNRFNRLRTAISEWGLSETNLDGICPLGINCFHLYTNNTLTGCRTGIEQHIVPLWDPATGYREPPPVTTLFGHVYRRTLMNGIVVGSVANQVNATFGSVPLLGMTVFDQLQVTDSAGGLSLSQDQTSDQILNAVTLSGNAQAATRPAVTSKAGEHPAFHAVTASGFATIWSTITPPGAILELPQRVVDLSTTATAVTGFLRVWNSGSASLNFTISDDATWLSVSPTSGTVTDTNASTSVNLHADPTGLAAGTYEALVTVTAGAQVQQATVRLRVKPASILATPVAPDVTGSGTATPSLSGNGIFGQRIRIVVDGRQISSVKVSSSGTWSYALVDLANGSHLAAVWVEDGSGATSALSAAVGVDVNRSGVPAAPGVPQVSANGTTTPRVFGRSTPNATLKVYGGSTLLATLSAEPDGSWSTTLAGLAPGSHEISVTTTTSGGTSASSLAITVQVASPPGNGSGLTGTYFNAYEYTVQRVQRIDPMMLFANILWGGQVPDPSLTGPQWSARWTGALEAKTSGTYQFYLSVGGSAAVWIDGIVVAQTSGSGFWNTMVSGSATLVAGRRTAIRIDYQEDGGHSEMRLQWASAFQSLQAIPTSQLYPNVPDAPAVPVAPTAPSVTDNGSAAPSLSGNSVANAMMMVYMDGTQVATVPTTGTGAWSYPIPGTVAQGPHRAQVAVCTGNGTSALSAATVFTRGGVPGKPATGRALQEGSIVVLTGTVIPGAVVTISNQMPGVGALGTAQADATGNWTFLVRRPGTTALGWYAYTITVTTTSGTSVSSDNFYANMTGAAVTVSTPATPTITGNGTRSVAASGSVTITSGSSAGVMVVVDGKQTALRNVAADGTWRWNINVLGAGSYSVAAITYVFDSVNCQASATSAITTVTVGTAWPGPLVPETPSAPIVVLDGIPAPVLSGSAAGGSWVHLRIQGVDFATTLVDGEGRWQALLANQGNGTYQVSVQTENMIGRSADSQAAAAVVAGNQPPRCVLTAPTGPFTAPAVIELSATATDPDGTVAKVEFFQGTTKLGEATTSPYTWSWSEVAVGIYTLTAMAIDNAGETTTSATVTVTVGSVISTQPESQAETRGGCGLGAMTGCLLVALGMILVRPRHYARTP